MLINCCFFSCDQQLKMCLPDLMKQCNSRGCDCRKLIIVMAVLGLIIIVIGLVIALASTSKGDACMDNLQCLPINQCEGHTNTDFAYGCGDHDSPMICCIAKKPGSTNTSKLNETLVNSRYHKKNLLPLDNCGVGETQDKISNGKTAEIGQFPWMAVLLYSQPGLDILQPLCGGTLINNRYILTAAHCLYSDINPSLELTHVRLGEVDLNEKIDCEIYENQQKSCADPPEEIEVESLIVHENFNKTTLKNDIALLRLERPVKYTDFIKPICLPYGIAINETYFQKRNFSISGWGKINSSSIGVYHLLQFTSVYPWDTKQCEEFLKAPQKPIEDHQVCASGPNIQEACKGDSGGPMTFEHITGKAFRSTQIGITSYKSVDTCGSEHVPTIYTRVDRHLDWILDHIEK